MVPTTSMTVQEALDAVAPVLALSLRFHTFKVPSNKTYVVSVLGSANFVDDDWFLADYCLLHKALGGTAKQEVWLTCSDICGFVKKYGPVRHGCPYHKPRRVVHDDSSDTFTQFVDPSRLADKFIKCLQSTAHEAISGEQILVIMIGHGSYLGDVELGSSFVSRDMVELALAGMREGVEVTIVTTACYSGLWAIPFENGQATVLSAGGGPNVSYSFPTSESGCNWGGFFAEVVVDELSSVAQGLRISSGPDLPVPTFGSMITQTISIPDINSGATDNIAFKPYVAQVITRLRNQRTTPAAVSFSGRSEVGQTVEVLGGSGNLSTLLRVGAVLDLPREAEFSSGGLAASNLFPQHKTARVNENIHAAHARILLEEWSGRTPGSSQMSRNTSISKLAKRLERGILDDEGCKLLGQRLLGRFRCDEEAQRIVNHLYFKFKKHAPDITFWDEESVGYPKNGFDRRYGSILKHLCIEVYDKPAHFVAQSAMDCGATVADVERIINCGVRTVVATMTQSHCTAPLSTSMSCSMSSLQSMESLFEKGVEVV
jgi:hypothetical protein